MVLFVQSYGHTAMPNNINYIMSYCALKWTNIRMKLRLTIFMIGLLAGMSDRPAFNNITTIG